ncbi:anillin-like [Acanthaster planci]|uniref:Anillin-like n=1 Tax=Acanthaster planci TaxID=133434 RepID=A0A8B7XW27_ACAPL|nr:anillin-like [Acanthaster planci]XP_022084051.1 anillin-like [Acanthaster planci]
MDEYTERLLERTRARSENLAKKMNQSQVSPRKRRTPLTDMNSSDSDEKKVRFDDSPVKSALQSSEVKPDTPAIPSIRSRMSKLADMRREWSAADGSELDSPQNVSAPRPRQQEDAQQQQPSGSSMPSTRKSRFAALAASINSWEDDLDHPKHHFQHEEKPSTRKWERPKPVEEVSDDHLPAKQGNGILSVTPKKPARSVRFEDQEDHKPAAFGNGQGKAQMRSLPTSSSPAREKNTSGEDSKSAKPGGKAELRSLPTGSPAKVSAYSRLVEQKQEVGKSSVGSPSKSTSGGTPARKRIQVSLSREREPSRLEVQKHFAQEQQQPTPKPRAGPPTTTISSTNVTSTTQSSTKRPAPQPDQAKKKQAVASSGASTNQASVKEGVTDVKAYFGRHKTATAPATTPNKVEPRVSAMAKSIQDRLRQHQENWQSNDINKKIQEQRKKELEIIKQRWNHSGKTEPAKQETEKEQPTPMPRVTITRSVPEPEANEDELDNQMEVSEDTINIGMVESPTSKSLSSSDEEEAEKTIEEEPTEVLQKRMTGEASCQEKEQATPLPPPREKVIAKASTQQPEETVSTSTPQAPPRPRRTNSKLLAEEEAKAQQESVSKHPQQEEDDDDDADDEYDDDDDDVQELNITDVLGDIDDLLNEAEQAMEVEKKAGNPTPSQRQEQPAKPQALVQKPPTGNASQPKPGAVTPQSPNLYSIESFRKQGPKSPAATKTIIRSKSGTVGPGEGVVPMVLKPIPIKEQIQTLTEEVSTQQSIIYQTSQALNLIASNAEYRGSRQEVEAERLLLIAAQRRQACLAEIQRLKTPMSARESNMVQTSEGEIMRPCKGFVTIQDIRLPLKTEYILSSKQDRMCHSFFLLLRCREHVLATRIQTTVDGVAGDCLPFSNIAKFNNLDSDFVIEAFVFEMQNKRPKVEDKSKQTFLSSLTPKKLLANMSKDSRQSVKAPIAPSPGGPGSVRASSFTLVGATRLTLQSCRVNRFMLSKVPFNSPLEGTVHLKMSCHTNANVIEHGWLTMFDDISGFGAWHRRWCVLSGGYISYWKYPDDENRKAPNGTIDLRQCVTNEVAPISRILCARPNTFELVTRQPASKAMHHGKDTLVTKHEDCAVTTKHMLSADVKEDRIRWINALNKTLLDLRTWCREAARLGPSQ